MTVEQDPGEDQHGFADYTAGELLELAQSNAQATILATARSWVTSSSA